MEKKYKLTDEAINLHGITLYRIEALKDFNNVKKGDTGGFVESELNLSQKGNCWIYDDACVYYGGRVEGDAYVFENAQVFNSAHIYEDAQVYDNARVSGNACVFGGCAYNSYDKGLGTFLPDYKVGLAYPSVGFLGCASQEIAQHFGKYFGMLIVEAEYGDMIDFEIISKHYID